VKLMIWNRVEKLTANWHDEGGLVIVARDLEHARAILQESQDRENAERARYGDTAGPCEAHTKNPDVVYDVGDAEPRIFVFPDVGCC
jgi:predicted fused transcriptional regulator/phosphomethylpyrimidine kinase